MSRLKQVISKLVDMNKMTFFKESQIKDVLLIADEALDLEEDKEDQGLFKLDRQKVYSHVNWDFLMDY